MENVKISLERYENLKKKADAVKEGYVYRSEYIAGYPVPHIQTESEIVNELLDTIKAIAISNGKLHDQVTKLSGELNKQDPDKWDLDSIFKFLGLDK